MEDEMFRFAVALAKKAGKYAYEKRNSIVVGQKDNDTRNLVTNVDLEIDQMLQKEILDTYPYHAIHSEESEGVVNDSEYQWALDPIDGTSNYARGIPNYAACVSVLKDKDVVIGVVYNPVTDECYTVDSSRVVTLNGLPIHVSNITELKEAYVNFHPGRKVELRPWAGALKIELLNTAKKSLNLGASALDLCFIASRKMDIVIYGTLTMLDIAGAIQILRAAGGEVYNYETKKPVEITNDIQQIIATNNNELLEDFYNKTGG